VHAAVLQRLEGARPEPLLDVIARARARAPAQPAALVERYRKLTRIQNELSYLEMHVSDHPMRVLRSDAERARCVPSHRLREHATEDVSFAGVIAAARSVPVAERDAAQFLTFEDEHGLVEARLSPDVYDRLHPLITTPGPFLVQARVVVRHGALHLAVRELAPFHQREAAARDPARA
jgi:DNA polymerase III alpha subunit